MVSQLKYFILTFIIFIQSKIKMRVKFEKDKQREFINEVLKKISAPSLSELIRRGIDVNYQTLKNYYSGRRLLSLEFFETLCQISNIKKDSLSYNIINDNWGQVKGGLKRGLRKGKTKKEKANKQIN